MPVNMRRDLLLVSIYEKYLKVMTEDEQEGLLAGHVPDLSMLHDWRERIAKRNQLLGQVFNRTKYYKNGME